MKFETALLVDWSAYARVLLAGRGGGARLPAAALDRFQALVADGRAWVCPPFRLEALYSTVSPEAHDRQRRILDAFPQAAADADCWLAAEEAQAELAAAAGLSHRVKPIDLVIAAIASRNGLGVLHYDRDYDVIAEHTSLAFESVWIAPRGSVD